MTRYTTSRCRSCGARIIWVRTRAGALAPVDAKADPKGTVVLQAAAEGDEYPTALFGVRDGEMEGVPRHVSHFATCPEARDWRRGRAPGGTTA